MSFRQTIPLLALFMAAQTAMVRAEGVPEVSLSFVGDRFDPAEVIVPASAKFTLRVENKSNGAMEWESHTLHREKVVAAGTSAKMTIGPLQAGSYEFFDDFHQTIRGHLVAR